MQTGNITKELSVLLCHYLKDRFPDTYAELVKYVEKNKLLPDDCYDITQALSVRYPNFPTDHFFQFIKTLRPEDDYPSIFRRITPFPKIVDDYVRFISHECKIACHKDSIYCMYIDPLSRVLITGSDDYSIKVFKLPELQFVKRLVGHEGCITNISCNPLCTMLLSSSHDKTIRLWSLVTGKCISVLANFSYDVVHSAIFSPSGSMIAAACEDGTVPLWTTPDAIQGKPPCRILRSPGKGPVAWVTFSPGGEFLAYSSEPSHVTVVPLKTMTQTILDLHQSLVDIVLFTHGFFGNGEYGPRLLTVSGEDGAVACWQMESGSWKTKYTIKHGVGRQKSKILKVVPDMNEHVFLLSRTNHLYACDMLTGETLGHFPEVPICEDVTCIAAHPFRPEIFFIGNTSGDAALVDTNKLEVISSIAHAMGTLNEACWSQDGSAVYAADNEGNVGIFRITPTKGDRKPVKDIELFEGHEFGYKENYLCDKKGNKLVPQPVPIDIRSLELPINMLQSTFLRDCANELALVQRIITNDHPEPVAPENHVDIAPPTHIPVTIDIINNPRGPNVVFEEETIQEEEDGDLNIEIESTSDEWDLDAGLAGDDDDNDFTMMEQSSEQIPGKWPAWQTAIVADELFYLPQVGDEVVIAADAYAKVGEEHNCPLPDDRTFNAGPARGTITEMASHEAGILLTIQVKGSNVNVVYPVPGPSSRFLDTVTRFRSVSESISRFSPQARVSVARLEGAGVKIQRGVIAKVAKDIAEHPHNSVTVRWDGSGNESTISPWDAFSVGRKRIYATLPQLTPAVEKTALSVIDSAGGKEPAIVSLKKLDEEAVDRITYPMSLVLIRERVKGGWYRSSKALIYDVEKLNSVVEEVFGKESPVTENTKSAVQHMITSINKASKSSSKKKSH